jgi:hypothetical protein
MINTVKAMYNITLSSDYPQLRERGDRNNTVCRQQVLTLVFIALTIVWGMNLSRKIRRVDGKGRLEKSAESKGQRAEGREPRAERR